LSRLLTGKYTYKDSIDYIQKNTKYNCRADSLLELLALFYPKKNYMIDAFLRHRIHLPDICLTGSICYDERKIYCQEGVLYGSTKQETRNT